MARDSSAAPSPDAAGDPKPLVSVIVPTHCRPEMLEEAVRSVLEQTFQNFEVVVINDGGPDVSEVLNRLETPGKIVHLRHEKTQDRSSARNTGLAAARGKYIAYLDDDDIFYPDHLESLVSLLKTTALKIAYSDACVAQQTKVTGRYVLASRKRYLCGEFSPDRMLISNFIPNLCVMHEKACLDVAGRFDPTLRTHEDWDLWIRFSRFFEFAHLKRVTCEFRFRDDRTNTTTSKRADFLRTTEIIYQRYQSHVGNNRRILKKQRRFLEQLRDEVAKASAGS